MATVNEPRRLRVTWRRPPERQADTGVAAAHDALDARSLIDRTVAAAAALRSAVEVYGMPEAEGADSPEKEVIALLQTAAEIEHALLVEYLYAGWSIGASAADLRARVREVAIQEMGHLITVQNLLLLVGSDPYFERQDSSPDPSLDPYPFSLDPLSSVVLEKFLLAEMPPLEALPADHRTLMEQILERHSHDAARLHRVGLIYAKLYWLLQADDAPTPPWTALQSISDLGVLRPGWHVTALPGQGSAGDLQASPEEPQWRYQFGHGGVFEQTASRQQALEAIFAIAAQGEGLATAEAEAESHFSVFLSLYQGFGSYPPSAFVRLPSNPFTSPVASPDPDHEINRITDPLAGALCELFDIRYLILLVALRAALAYRRSDEAEKLLRADRIAWALEEMGAPLRGLVNKLVRLPAKDGGSPTQLAAAPTLSPSRGPLPGGVADLERFLQDLHRDSTTRMRAVLAQNPDAATRLLMEQILAIDKRRYASL